MAFGQNPFQVTWDTGSNTKSIAAGGSGVSDTFTMSTSLAGAIASLIANHSGTPADGDTVDFYLIEVSDPDQDSTNEDDNQGHWFKVLDIYKAYTDSGNTDTYCKRPHPFFALKQGGTYKIQADNNGASSVTVAVRIQEETWS